MNENTIIEVPRTLSTLIEQLVQVFAQRNGESVDDCRRAVHVSILARGVQALQAELGADGATVGEVPAGEGRVA